MNASILSRIAYLAPFLASETCEVQKKAFKIIHRAARFIIGHYGYKQSIKSIMSSIDWKIPEEFISQASARFIHKIVITETPKPIFDLI